MSSSMLPSHLGNSAELPTARKAVSLARTQFSLDPAALVENVSQHQQEYTLTDLDELLAKSGSNATGTMAQRAKLAPLTIPTVPSPATAAQLDFFDAADDMPSVTQFAGFLFNDDKHEFYGVRSDLQDEQLHAETEAESVNVDLHVIAAAAAAAAAAACQHATVDEIDADAVAAAMAPIATIVTAPTPLQLTTVRSVATDARASKARKTKASTTKTATGSARKRRPKMAVPDELKDDKYWARRMKNTEAARRNRLMKKIEKEAELNRLPKLEETKKTLADEVQALTTQIANLRAEVAKRIAAATSMDTTI